MTSTTSFKSKLRQSAAMFAWDLKACSGTLTVYAIIAGVFTVMMLLLCLFSDTFLLSFFDKPINYGMTSYVSSTYPEPIIPLSQKIELFQVAVGGIIYLLTIIFTVFYTIKVYSYMHDKRKADFYCSLPISRLSLYLTKTVSAYLFSIVPALFFMGIISLISVCTGTLMVTEVVDMYLQLIIGTLACVSCYGFVALCCGTTMNAVIMFLVVCIAYPLAALFVKGTVNGFFFGVYTGSLNDSFIMNALNPIAAYSGNHVIYWLIFSAVCILGGAFLVRKRKSERAQTSFAFYLPCYVIKLLVAFIAGMFLATIFGSLELFGNAMVAFAFGFILAAVPTYIIAHLIFYKGFTKLLKSSIPLAVMTVVAITAVALCNADVFGYNSFVPTAKDVKSAGFIASDYYYKNPESDLYDSVVESSKDFTDEQAISDIIDMNTLMVDSDTADASDKFDRIWIGMVDDVISNVGIGDSVSYNFAYKLNNGSVVTRCYSDAYSMRTTSVGFEYIIDFSDTKLLEAKDKIIYTPEYISKYSGIANAETIEFNGIDICSDYCSYGSISSYYGYDLDVNGNPIVSSEQLVYKKIADALVKDIEENGMADYDDKNAFLSIAFDIQNSANAKSFGEIFCRNENYVITENCRNTLNVLVSEGFLNDDFSLNENNENFY